MVIVFDHITISSGPVSGILLANKLFELGYSPKNISVITCHHDAILESFCQKYQISFNIVYDDSTLTHFVSNNRIDLLINIGGMPFLISATTLSRIKVAAINLHTAILERYRGRWMVSWALINGDVNCGYTWHHINTKFDSGNIIFQKEFKIQKNDTAFSLNHLIVNDAIHNLDKVLEKANLPGTVPSVLGTYYNKDIPFNGNIQSSWNLDEVDRFIRAMYYPPFKGARYDGQLISSVEQYIKVRYKLDNQLNNENFYTL